MKKILLLLVAATLAAPGFAQSPRTPQQIDIGLGKAVGPAVASEDGLTAIIWKEDGTQQMFVSTSTTDGVTWSAAVRIDDSPNANSKFAKDIGLIIRSGVIYASWSDQRTTSGEDDLYFTMSTDGGATWTADMVIDKGYANGANDLKDWRMMVDGSTVAFMSATENDGGGFSEEVFLTVSTDGGVTFGAAMAISTHPNGTVDVDAISAAASSGTLHMVWQDNFSTTDNECFYASYDVASGTFNTTDVLVSASLVGGNVENDLRIAANGSLVAVAYQADNLPSSSRHILHVNTSTDGGASWGGGVQVGNYTAGTDDADHPAIVVNSNGNISVIHEDNRTGSDELYISTSTDSGATWTETLSQGVGGFPEITGDGDYLGANWTGGGFPESSLFTCSRDGGLTWGPVTDLTLGQTGDADFAELAFNAMYHNFVAVWLDDTTTVNQAFAGGARCQTLTPVGPFIAGSPVHFEGSNFGTSETGDLFMVLVSTALGVANIPFDGRDIGLAVTGVLLQSAASPLLKGTIAADGSATTPVTSFPGIWPVGTTLYAVGLTRVGTVYGAVTDVASFTVQ